jgi:cytochrome P450
MLSWIIDDALGHEKRENIRELTLRILTLNFAAIHATTMSFTSALFYLAASPNLAEPLREELQAVTAEHGWTKQAMDHLIKMDSFLKESQRLMGLGNLGLTRKALKDYTFSDGQNSICPDIRILACSDV